MITRRSERVLRPALNGLLIGFLVGAMATACGGATPAPAEPGPMAGHDHDHHHHAHHHMMPPVAATPGRGAELAISCGAAAQKPFDQGFFFLHNMDYVQARKSFEDAAAVTPSCAMLHWGVAMTYFQPLWPGQPTVDSLKSWAAGQKLLADKYPDDVEAQAFSDLARLATLDKSDKTYKESVAVAADLEKLLAKRPEHPGLMHYLMHANDNPAHAKEALDIARKYEAITPDGAHALHMPSHIHVRLGNWQEVIDWNIKSAAAGLKHPAADGRISRDWLHATDYMIYGYLQLGDDEHAKEIAQKIDPKALYELSSGPGAYGLAATPARYALERKQWKEAAALVPRAVPYNWEQYPWAEAVTHGARGLGAAHTGDLKTAEKEIAELYRLTPLIESPWWQKRVQIERDVIAAWVAHARKDDKKAEELLRGAAKREGASGKDSVEPGHVISASEDLGELLLELKRPVEALAAFKTALEESPRRFNAVAGAGRAAELANLPQEATSYYKQLVDGSSPASTRPARIQAQAYLAKHP